jgi:hypothetical protein
VAVLVGIGRNAASSQNIAERTVEERLPAVPMPEQATEGGSGAPAYSDGPGLTPPPFSAGGHGAPVPGRVTLDLAQGEFHIEPAPPGEPLRVEAEYDLDLYELSTELDEGDDGEWEYEVAFRRLESAGFTSFLARVFGAKGPRVTVYLPREVPMDLDLRFVQGGGDVDLGGLWLRETEVSFTQGGGDLEFSEPLRQPAESLTIDASMGGGAFRRVGNASPRRLEVTTRMGGGEVDLRGEWSRDCEISLESSMGGMEIRLPDGVNTRGLRRDREAVSDEEGGDVPTLSFTTSAEMGEIEFLD